MESSIINFLHNVFSKGPNFNTLTKSILRKQYMSEKELTRMQSDEKKLFSSIVEKMLIERADVIKAAEKKVVYSDEESEKEINGSIYRSTNELTDNDDVFGANHFVEKIYDQEDDIVVDSDSDALVIMEDAMSSDENNEFKDQTGVRIPKKASSKVAHSFSQKRKMTNSPVSKKKRKIMTSQSDDSSSEEIFVKRENNKNNWKSLSSLKSLSKENVGVKAAREPLRLKNQANESKKGSSWKNEESSDDDFQPFVNYQIDRDKKPLMNIKASDDDEVVEKKPLKAAERHLPDESENAEMLTAENKAMNKSDEDPNSGRSKSVSFSSDDEVLSKFSKDKTKVESENESSEEFVSYCITEVPKSKTFTKSKGTSHQSPKTKTSVLEQYRTVKKTTDFKKREDPNSGRSKSGSLSSDDEVLSKFSKDKTKVESEDESSEEFVSYCITEVPKSKTFTKSKGTSHQSPKTKTPVLEQYRTVKKTTHFKKSAAASDYESADDEAFINNGKLKGVNDINVNFDSNNKQKSDGSKRCLELPSSEDKSDIKEARDKEIKIDNRSKNETISRQQKRKFVSMSSETEAFSSSDNEVLSSKAKFKPRDSSSESDEALASVKKSLKSSSGSKSSSDSEDNKDSKSKKKQKTTDKKKKLSPSNAKIEKLKRYLRIAGIRVSSFNKIFECCQTLKSKAEKLQQLLEDEGLKGSPTIQKCKKLRKKMEKKKEVQELDVNNIITTKGRSKRNALSLYSSKPQTINDLEEEEVTDEQPKRKSNILVDSDDSCSELKTFGQLMGLGIIDSDESD